MVSAAAVAAPLRGGRWVIVGGAREDDQRQIPIGKEGEPGGGREGGFDIPKSALHAAPAHRQHDARPMFAPRSFLAPTQQVRPAALLPANHDAALLASAGPGGGGEEVFRTVIPHRDFPFKLKADDKLSLMGSCFSINIGDRLRDLQFGVDVNPFGISYSPLSLAWGLTRLLDPAPFTDADLSFADGRFFSYQHHTRFSHADKGECLAGINSSLERARHHLLHSRALFLTLGSSWAFTLAETNQVVANCHKQPSSLFTR
ncbi:GSCFA family-domain-containing protein, partial [Baffinella frigidus]